MHTVALLALSCAAPGAAHLDATLTYTARMDADTLCDVEIRLSGAPFEGECADCAWAFQLTPAVVSDESREDCLARTSYSLFGRSEVPLVLAAYDLYSEAYTYYVDYEQSSYDGYDGYYKTVYFDVPGALVAFYDEPYRVKDLLAPTAHASTTFSDTSVDWQLDESGESSFLDEPWGALCPTLAQPSDLSGPVEGYVNEATFECTGALAADVWQVDGTAGDDWEFEAELANPDEFVIAELMVADAHGCWIVPGFDTRLADCTYDSHLCSGAGVHLTSDGPVSVLVSFGCADQDPDVDYHLLVRGPDGPAEARRVAEHVSDSVVSYADVAQSVRMSGPITR